MSIRRLDTSAFLSPSTPRHKSNRDRFGTSLNATPNGQLPSQYNHTEIDDLDTFFARACAITPPKPRPGGPDHNVFRKCKTTKHNNSNGNAGRPYKLCLYCDDWICWGDNVGILAGNPKCFCEKPSRQDRMGMKSKRPGWGFWTCARGECDFYSDDLYGKVPSVIGRCRKSQRFKLGKGGWRKEGYWWYVIVDGWSEGS